MVGRVVEVFQALDDLAEVIANPNPDRPFENAVGGFGRAVCNRYSASPTSFLTDAISPWDDICKPYWEGQGYSPPASSPPGFSGGQCAVAYRVRGTVGYTATFCSSGSESTSSAVDINFLGNPLLQGPITSVKHELYNQFGCFGGGSTRVVIQHAGGTTTIGVTEFSSGVSFKNPTQSLNFVREDGQADTCGNPAPVVVPGPNPAPDPGPLPPGTGPQIDVRGNPVLILPPTLELSPTVEVAIDVGDISFGGPEGGNTPAEPPTPGGEMPGEPGGGGDTDFGDPPESRRWAGCCVSLTVKPPGLGVIPSSIPNDVYAEVVGNARLKFAGEGVSGLDSPIQIRSETVCLWEPVRGLAPTGVFVNVKPGFSYVVRPYSIPLEQ